jgi:glycosyltransferase involved in cell wall biosynthesis
LKEDALPRILHLIASDLLGGPEKQLLHHARDTRMAGYQIVLGSFQEGPRLPEFLTVARRHGVETVAIPGGVRPGLVDDLAGYLRSHAIDLLCTHGYKANVVGHFAAKHAGIPAVPFVHGFTGETWQVTLYERLERSLLVRSPWVVCTSPAQARELGRLRRGRRAPLVIQNAVLAPRDVERMHGFCPSREELGYSGRSFVFGAAGRFTRDKGHRYLLEAFSLLRKMAPEQPMELLLLGEGREEDALRAQARRLGIESQVCFAGFQSRPGLWMKVMNCVVHPSLTEGTSNTMLEAMLLGIPVIATSVEDSEDLIQDGETGLLAAPESAQDLAERMKELLDSPALCHHLAQNAQTFVGENFSPSRQRHLLEMLYGSLLQPVFAHLPQESADVVA